MLRSTEEILIHYGDALGVGNAGYFREVQPLNPFNYNKKNLTKGINIKIYQKRSILLLLTSILDSEMLVLLFLR
jgi:hypothetical protein